MKIKNTLTLLASMLIAFAIFACNHSPQAKGKDDKDNKVVTKNKAEDTIATALAAKLKEFDAAVEKVKDGIKADWFDTSNDNKLKAGSAGIDALNALVKANGLGDTLTSITTNSVKADVVAAVDAAANNAKTTAINASIESIRNLKNKDYDTDVKIKDFLRAHKALEAYKSLIV